MAPTFCLRNVMKFICTLVTIEFFFHKTHWLKNTSQQLIIRNIFKILKFSLLYTHCWLISGCRSFVYKFPPTHQHLCRPPVGVIMPKKVSNPTCSSVSEVLLVNLYMEMKSVPELTVELYVWSCRLLLSRMWRCSHYGMKIMVKDIGIMVEIGNRGMTGE